MTTEEEQIIQKELRPFMNSAMQLTAYPVKKPQEAYHALVFMP